MEARIALERFVELGEWMCVGFSSESRGAYIYIYHYVMVD